MNFNIYDIVVITKISNEENRVFLQKEAVIVEKLDKDSYLLEIITEDDDMPYVVAKKDEIEKIWDSISKKYVE